MLRQPTIHSLDLLVALCASVLAFKLPLGGYFLIVRLLGPQQAATGWGLIAYAVILGCATVAMLATGRLALPTLRIIRHNIAPSA